jgi:hypothetical protein
MKVAKHTVTAIAHNQTAKDSSAKEVAKKISQARVVRKNMPEITRGRYLKPHACERIPHSIDSLTFMAVPSSRLMDPLLFHGQS